MSNDQITDLKQFFATTLNAALEAALEPIRADIKLMKAQIEQLQRDVIQLYAITEQLQTDQKSMRQEMLEGFAAVGDAMERMYRQDDYHAGLLEEVAQKWGQPRAQA